MADNLSAAGLVRPVDLADPLTHTVDLSGLGTRVGATKFDVVMLAVPAGSGEQILNSIFDAARIAHGMETSDERRR
jgi:hypothetical protein